MRAKLLSWPAGRAFPVPLSRQARGRLSDGGRTSCLLPPAWLIVFRSGPFRGSRRAPPSIDFRAGPACFYFVAHKLCNLVLSSPSRPAIKSCASARGVCFDGRIRIRIRIRIWIWIRSGINQIPPFRPDGKVSGPIRQLARPLGRRGEAVRGAPKSCRFN